MIKLIAAVGDKGLLGLIKDGAHTLPWDIKEDMKHFSESTKGAVVIMGRTTWESLPLKFRPLPGRENIVLTRNTDFVAEGARVFTSLPEALSSAGSFEKDIWIIGGASVYKEALPFVDELSLTSVLEETLPPLEEGFEKVLFPEYKNVFECIETSEYVESEGGTYRFETWRRIR